MCADLTTAYLGIKLKNPIVASSSPLTGDLDTLSRLEQAGVAAAVLPSLFEEQITHDRQRVHQLKEIKDSFRPNRFRTFRKRAITVWVRVNTCT